MTDFRRQALKILSDNRGKIEVAGKLEVKTMTDLSLAYTPGVAEACKEIHADREQVFTYTARGNLVAVVSDGTAVLGLGDIGPEAAMPVMEGKALLFKAFAGIDAFPVCLGTKDPDEIVRTVKLLEPTFGGINLEDISAPRCFEIERRLKEEMDIPVFHDDQHGTAVVVLAAVLNSLKLVGKNLSEATVVVNGAGSAGIAITKLLLKSGVGDLIMVDRHGIIYPGADGNNQVHEEMAKVTNKNRITGKLADAVRGADVFVGVSAPGVLTKEMVAAMAKDAVVFAMANPVPEIMPDEALAAGARVVGTGRSDYPNQVNNVLAFPGIFRGALDVRARDITDSMKVAAAYAIAGLIPDSELRETNVIPQALDRRVVPVVAQAVAETAVKEGMAKLNLTPEQIRQKMEFYLK